MEVERVLRSEEETMAAGRLLGDQLESGSLLLLDGELGAGKTTFIKGIAAALDVVQRVQSPTYAIMHEYEGRLPLYHFDLYRLVSPEQLHEIGFFEYTAREGICVVEWPDRLGDQIRYATHRLWLEHHPEGRLLTSDDFPADCLDQL